MANTANEVLVRKVPGGSRRIPVANGMNLKQAIKIAEFDVRNCEVRINGEAAVDFDRKLNGGDRVLITEAQTGN